MSANRRPASIVQDEQPTSNSEAEPIVVPPTSADPSNPSEAQALAFDASAFEDAASQFRPSWEAVTVAAVSEPAAPANLTSGTHPVVPPPAVALVPVAAALMRGEADVPANLNVVVPRAPRTPRVDYAPAAAEPEDDFGLSAAGIPTHSPRTLWMAGAAVFLLAVLGFALTRGGSDEGPAAAKAVPEARVVAPVDTKPVPLPGPAPKAELVAPSAPAVAAPAPVAVVPEPVAAPKAPPEHQARKVSSSGQRESSSRRSEKRAAAARAHVSVPERHATPKVVPTSKPKTQRRGAGFVSTNPY